ncbi:hypothetical protein O6H91_07G008900 [Diphasiastrum complanatum]|uniref:Uncharacterized protein n=1 Tax=Diphasiastrum complanatum TaxID=34168 RepID=A0ACC2D2G7_DIPCM|nr:hypothetical protein O6H91_07G008900 [Diphasiastrum complanatum]
MSSVYVLEPPTRGKVVLTTTSGPLDFELWAKEAPKTVRNFVQLCMEGYYDGTIFHRIIKTFMVQGGDPSGTGTGGESIYGSMFPDEFHSRLRFNHRGLVASANAGTPNSNSSQFFMTLDRCDWLDRKNTIFAKVTGETIYNLLKLGDLETDKDDRPLDPPRIISVEVLWNPFEDIVPRQLAKRPDTVAFQGANQEVKAAEKGKKKLNLLSFGEEALQEEELLVTVKGKIKSSHDVLEDPRLLKEETIKMDANETRRIKELQSSVRQALTAGTKDNQDESKPTFHESIADSDEDEDNFDMRMRREIIEKRKRLDDSKAAKSNNQDGKRDISKHDSIHPRVHEEEDETKRTRKDRLSIKQKGVGSEAKAEMTSKADLDAQLLSPLEQQRQKYKQRKRTLKGREEVTLAMLNKFKSNLSNSKSAADKLEGKKPDLEDETDWLNHSLKFTVAAAKKDDMSKNDDPNQYVVHDPLLEKGKEKFNKMQAKIKRRTREWAGNSLS